MSCAGGHAADVRHSLRLEHKFAPTIKQILGLQFIGQDPVLDLKEATDFATFVVKPFRVGVRLRTHRYLASYGNEFTIRWSRPVFQGCWPYAASTTVKTEIHKIRDGHVDYILYGFVDESE